MTRINKNDTIRLLREVNLNHLLYFWAVGQAGSVTGAAERLGIAQPGVTSQLRRLEKQLGAVLFDRGPRGVRLTKAGQVAMRYAEEIVGICSELFRSIPLSESEEDRPLHVGTADAVPKTVIRTILRSLMQSPATPRVICREWRIDHLLAELSLHRLDLVISDLPLPISDGTSLQSFTAGSSTIELCAAPDLARRLRRGFPGSVSHAPMLIPAEGTSLRMAMDRWFALHRLRPQIAAETEDRALLHHLAEDGQGVLPVASIEAPDVCRQFGLERIGALENVREEYFVITIERQNEHRALASLREMLSTGAGKKKSPLAALASVSSRGE